MTGRERADYYDNKVRTPVRREGQLNTSLVAECNGKIVGFLMGTLTYGEFCIPEPSAIIDAVGVDPAYQDHGVGGALFDQYRANMRAANVDKVYALVDWKDFHILKFFGNMGFVPSQRINLELPIK